MPSYRCGYCAINYPLIEKFRECPVCSNDCRSFRNENPDPDWLEQAFNLVKETEGGDVRELLDTD